MGKKYLEAFKNHKSITYSQVCKHLPTSPKILQQTLYRISLACVLLSQCYWYPCPLSACRVRRWPPR